ncbi:MAG: hypothetical protein IJO48_06215, partial [Clostridia bacterium]|nr:hypothetical protein [Clostridia bacterium]
MKRILAAVLSLMMVFSIIPVISTASTADGITHLNFLNASSRYEKFVTSTDCAPNYVTAGNQRLNSSEYLYLAADAIMDIADGNSIDVTYKSVSNVLDRNAREELTAGDMLRSEYIALAEAAIAAVDENNSVPVCFGTTLGAISPKNVAYVFAKVLQYYRNNKTLPASVAVGEWAGADYKAPETAPALVGTISATVRASRFLSAATRIKAYVDAKKELPASTEIDGQTLTMAQFLATAVDVYLSGKTQGDITVRFANAPSSSVDDLGDMGGIVDKAEFDSMVAVMDEAITTQVPASVEFTNFTLGYKTLVYIMADALAQINISGTLTEGVEIKSWAEITAPEVTTEPTVAPTVAPTPTAEPTPDGIFTIAEVAAAAKAALSGYTSGTPFYKEGITVDGITVAQQNYYIIAAQAIQDIYNNKTTATYTNASHKYNVPTLIANYDIKMTSGAEATTASQAFYMNFAIRQTIYVNGSGAGTVGASAAYPTNGGNANGFPVTDYTGQMTYEAGLLMFSRVLAAYAANGSLPNSVALEYVPAEASEETDAPETT